MTRVSDEPAYASVSFWDDLLVYVPVCFATMVRLAYFWNRAASPTLLLGSNQSAALRLQSLTDHCRADE